MCKSLTPTSVSEYFILVIKLRDSYSIISSDIGQHILEKLCF